MFGGTPEVKAEVQVVTEGLILFFFLRGSGQPVLKPSNVSRPLRERVGFLEQIGGKGPVYLSEIRVVVNNSQLCLET